MRTIVAFINDEKILAELLDDDAFDLLGMLFEKPLPLAELFEEEDPLDLVGILFEKLLGSDFEGFEFFEVEERF